MNKQLTTLILLLLMVGVAKAQTYTTMSPMPTARAAATCAAIGNNIYVIGGGGNGAVLTVVERYNTDTDSWQTMSPMPIPIGETFSCAYNNRIYVFGGYTGTGCSNQVYEYNPATNTWLYYAQMPLCRSQLSGALINGKVYLNSGWPNSYTNTDIYDFATNTWTVGAHAYQGTIQVNSGAAYNNKFFVIGGKDFNNSILYADNQSFDPNTNSWTAANSLPAGIYAGTAVTYNGKIHYFGGSQNTIYATTNKHYSYNGLTWSSNISMPYNTYLSTSCTVLDNAGQSAVYIFGGRNSNGDLNNTTKYSETISAISNHKNISSANAWMDYNSKTLTIQQLNPIKTTAYIYNTTGALVAEIAVDGSTFRTSLDHLSAGIYLLKMKADDGMLIKKIAVQ